MKKFQFYINILTTLMMTTSCVYHDLVPEGNCGMESGIRFSSTVAPIIQNNCAISNCHNGTQFPDLRQLNEIKQNASSIRSQVVSRAMPQDGSLTQAEIDAITCWIDNGAPDN